MSELKHLLQMVELVCTLSTLLVITIIIISAYTCYTNVCTYKENLSYNFFLTIALIFTTININPFCTFSKLQQASYINVCSEIHMHYK